MKNDGIFYGIFSIRFEIFFYLKLLIYVSTPHSDKYIMKIGKITDGKDGVYLPLKDV